MKQVGSIVNGLKFILKYAVVITAIIKIISYAITELENLDFLKKEKENQPLENE